MSIKGIIPLRRNRSCTCSKCSLRLSYLRHYLRTSATSADKQPVLPAYIISEAVNAAKRSRSADEPHTLTTLPILHTQHISTRRQANDRNIQHLILLGDTLANQARRHIQDAIG